MTSKAYSSGDVQILQFDIVSMDGRVRQSIISQIVSFDVYESIMLPVMYCDVLVNDAINLLEKFPIIGEEFIEIEFKNPELNSVQSFRFKVASVTNKFTDNMGNRLFYTLQCASEEILINSNTYIQRRYNNGNSYSIVSDILKTDLKTTKRLNLDTFSSRGLDLVTINQLTPLQAIDFIRKRTVSKQYKTSSYVFFENRNGFNFTTLEHLIQTGKSAIGDKIFFYDSAVSDSMSNVDIRNMLAYQQLTYNNTAELMQSGALANRTIALDLKTGSINTVDFDYSKNVNKFAQTDADNISKVKTSSFVSAYNKGVGTSNIKNIMIPKTSNSGDTYREESAGYLQSYVNQLTQNIVRILVYGDSAVTAGNVIKLKFPTITGTTEKPDSSKLSSGNYLVTKCRHMFVIRGRVTYKMALECVKPSYGESDI